MPKSGNPQSRPKDLLKPPLVVDRGLSVFSILYRLLSSHFTTSSAGIFLFSRLSFILYALSLYISFSLPKTPTERSDMTFLRYVGQVFLFFAVLCLALVSVSAPIVPRIAFLTGKFSQDITLMLGATGGCIMVGKSQTCPSAQLGYSISELFLTTVQTEADETLTALDNFPGKERDGPEPLNSTLTFAMVVFPLGEYSAILGDTVIYVYEQLRSSASSLSLHLCLAAVDSLVGSP